MSSTTGTPLEIDIDNQYIKIVSKPGTGPDADKLRLWINERLLHEHKDCVRVRAHSRNHGLHILFEQGSHEVNGKKEEHRVYGFVEVEKNGTVVVPSREWKPSEMPNGWTQNGITVSANSAEGGVMLHYVGEKLDDVVRFTFSQLYWLTPDGRRHEYDHGDPNVVIKVVSSQPTSATFPDC
jgi:hypothetical protein